MESRAVIGVPIYTLSAYGGMGRAPAALRRAGVTGALGVTKDFGDVKIPRLTKDLAEGKAKNLSHFRAATLATYELAKSVHAEGVIVLGGECSETVGVMAGFAESFGGKAGMLWMDAHGDFNTPETSPSGYIGGMCLAMAAGRGFDPGTSPSLSPERMVHVGSRALDPPEAEAFRDSDVVLFDSKSVKTMGAAEVAKRASRRLDSASDWIACHLDLDVIDPTMIPAINYPTPRGISLKEAAALVRALQETGKFKVLEIAAYNADKDKDGTTAKRIADLCRCLLS